jgi:hypothetical protein
MSARRKAGLKTPLILARWGSGIEELPRFAERNSNR